jgi:AbrB family looped-hinge helix DNA binding protein
MSKVTSKLQVTIPKTIAEQYGIEPGSEVTFEPAGDAIRVRVAGTAEEPHSDVAWKLRLFDAATRRQRARNARASEQATTDRGWTRDDLYGDRGLSR